MPAKVERHCKPLSMPAKVERQYLQCWYRLWQTEIAWLLLNQSEMNLVYLRPHRNAHSLCQQRQKVSWVGYRTRTVLSCYRAVNTHRSSGREASNATVMHFCTCLCKCVYESERLFHTYQTWPNLSTPHESVVSTAAQQRSLPLMQSLQWLQSQHSPPWSWHLLRSCKPVSVHMCVCVWMKMCAYVRVCVRVCVCVCACMCVCVCVREREREREWVRESVLFPGMLQNDVQKRIRISDILTHIPCVCGSSAGVHCLYCYIRMYKGMLFVAHLYLWYCTLSTYICDIAHYLHIFWYCTLSTYICDIAHCDIVVVAHCDIAHCDIVIVAPWFCGHKKFRFTTNCCCKHYRYRICSITVICAHVLAAILLHTHL